MSYVRISIILMAAALWTMACEEDKDEGNGTGAGVCDDVSCGDHGVCEELEGKATCKCDDGYHADDLTCVEDAPQVTCDPICGTNEQCVDAGDGTGQCECVENFIADTDGVCQACPSGDEACDTTSEVCVWDADLDTPAAVCECADTYVADTDAVCQACPTGDEACDATSEVCVWDATLDTPAAACECADGFVADPNETCQSCPTDCAPTETCAWDDATSAAICQ